MSAAPALNLSPQEFAAAFPFHIVLDDELRVLQTGAVLRRLCPELTEGAVLGEHFSLERPALQRIDFDAVRQHRKSLFVLRHKGGSLRLRGEIVVQGRHLYYLGSPWVTGSTVPCRGLLGSFALGSDVQLPEAMSSVVKAR